jgi:hypothetical protein
MPCANYCAHICHRAIVEYLKIQSGPPVVEIFSYDDLSPHIEFLNEVMENDSRFNGIIAIVLGVFPHSSAVCL